MSNFETVCSVDDLVKNSGVNALVNGQQVAIYYIDDQVFAIGNYDPVGKANVMSRGMTGSIGDTLVVAAPLYKENYNLATGVCIEDETLSIPSYEAKIENGSVLVKV
ncbi:MAG: nitrite reductase (NADH) small subunit [Thiomicrorhabdus sp.]|nr:MAG: nitrite reductase (NADH) small subunit [Thiomicrorhabdus sp.]